MSQEKSIYDATPTLWNYFKNKEVYPNKNPKGNLRLIATIGDGAESIDWGIFFGNKGSRPQTDPQAGDLDFQHGSVTRLSPGSSLKWLSWETIRPLWLVPISHRARREAYRCIEEKTFMPKIQASVVAIHNEGKTGGNWDYDFDDALRDAAKWEADPKLILSPDSMLTGLSAKGEWVELQMNNETKWPVWLTTKIIETKDRLIVFNSPQCYIINTDGKYPSHSLWFGIRQRESGQEVNKPFITIGEDKNPESGIGACPLVWRGSTRLDDVFTPRLKIASRVHEVEVDHWVDDPSPLYQSSPFASPVADRKNTIEFNKEFVQHVPPTASLKPWLIGEEANKGGKVDQCFHVIYFRHYLLLKNSEPAKAGTLAAIVARTTNENYATEQYIRNFQICRSQSSHLFSRIRFVENLELDKAWSITKKVRMGLEVTSASAPVGIVPEISGFPAVSHSFVGEWKASNRSSCQSFQFIFDLENTRLFRVKPGTVGQATISLEILRDEKGSSIQGKGLLLRNADLEYKCDGKQVADNGTLFRFYLKKYSLKNNIILRDGSMVFSLNSNTFDHPEGKMPPTAYGQFRTTLQLKKAQTPFFLWQWHSGLDSKDEIVSSYAIDDFSLPVIRVQAGGQDAQVMDNLLAPRSLGTAGEGFGERSEPALIIPLTEEPASPDAAAGAANKYLLTFSESINLSQDFRLDIRLQEFWNQAGINKNTQIKAIVLDVNPQLVALVDARFLQQPGYDDGAWVLARKSPMSINAGSWEILDDSASTAGFHLILPSQAIGEAYVKGKPGQTTSSPNGEPVEGEAIDYRFGAPAVLRLGVERLEKRYVTIPWNLRRIWGQPGDKNPGAPFLESYFEMLYGLAAHLKPEKAYIGELASKLGEIPVPPVNFLAWQPTLKQQEAFSRAWQQYLSFYRAWKSRLAILEPSAEDPFTNTSFSKNLSFSPRIAFELNPLFDELIAYLLPNQSSPGVEGLIEKTRKLKNDIQTGAVDEIIKNDRQALIEALDLLPLPEWSQKISKASPLKRKGAGLKYPIDETTLIPEEIMPSDLADPSRKMLVAHDVNGLAGGFHYGFEAESIYKEFWREAFAKGSSSAEIKAPAFSSLGAWGKQTARFAADKTVIRSTTTMGRTHFYAVERIGRIGVFWNKAKHVIEYERIVVPSAQFKGYQPEHAGRPLVRKVREYIEILEPARQYPDFKTDIPDAPGSVTGCSFKSIIIPVLSAWGRDVWGSRKNGSNEKGMIGWEVPLWKRGADPTLYPKPQVVLSMLAAPDADEKSVIQNLSDPENLWFYTDTREFVIGENQQRIDIASDVHSWPAVQHVDFSDLPEPGQYDIAPSAGFSAEEMQIPLPDAQDVLPGFERYTFRVDKNEIPSSVAGRYYPSASITGRMRTVSMMRSKYTNAAGWLVPPNPNASAEEKTYYNTKKVMSALAYGSGSLLAKMANGFDDLSKGIVFGRIPKIEEYVKKVHDDLTSSQVLNSLSDISKNIDAPKILNLEIADLWADLKLDYYPFQWLWRESLEAGDAIAGRVLSFYDLHRRRLESELEQLIRSGNEFNAIELLKRFREQIEMYQPEFQFSANTIFSSILKILDRVELSVTHTLTGKFAELYRLIDKLDVSHPLSDLRQLLKDKAGSTFDAVGKVVCELMIKLKKINNSNWKNQLDKIKLTIENRTKIARESIINIIEHTADAGQAYVVNVKNKITGQIKDFEIGLTEQFSRIFGAANEIVAEAKSTYREINAKFTNVHARILEQLNITVEKIEEEWARGKEELLKTLTSNLDSLRTNIAGILSSTIREMLGTPPPSPASVYGILKTLNDVCKEFKKLVKAQLVDFFKNVTDSVSLGEWLDTLDAYDQLKNAIGSGDRDAILSASVALANSVNREFGRLTEEVSQKIKDAERLVNAADQVVQAGRQTLNNFRSVWEEFTAPGMGLNRRTVALIVRTDIKDIEQRLSITPCISRVKQFGEELEGLGLKLPVAAITERLLPAKAEWKELQKSLLSKFDFSSLFSDLGGMRFDKLLPGLKMPEFARDKIKMTHDFDRQNLSAWVNTEADILLGGKKKLLSVGPLQIELENGRFSGKARIEVDIDGKIKKINSGQLTGSWHLSIAGTGLMIFRDTSVIFKDGKLTFDLDPRRMEMPGLLKMLTDATTKLSDSGMSGGTGEDGQKNEVFKVGLVKFREIPAGVRAQLNLPPISVGGGTTAITNLSFGGHFELLALDSNLKFKFLLGLGFYLGKKETPFNITIFILGGGGYIDCALTFAPKEGLAIDFVMSVHASVSLAIALGWMTGFVAIMVGLEGEYHKKPKQGSSVYITIFVRVVGVVDILSLVTVFLYLSLEATYRSMGNGSQLVGTGQVKLEIRVCRFIKIKVKKSYSKTFAGSGNSGNTSLMIQNLTDAPGTLSEITRKANSILQSLA